MSDVPEVLVPNIASLCGLSSERIRDDLGEMTRKFVEQCRTRVASLTKGDGITQTGNVTRVVVGKKVLQILGSSQINFFDLVLDERDSGEGEKSALFSVGYSEYRENGFDTRFACRWNLHQRLNRIPGSASSLVILRRSGEVCRITDGTYRDTYSFENVWPVINKNFAEIAEFINGLK